MNLNPAKCAFGSESRKFLGLVVSEWGIEAKPKKVESVLNMAPPQNTNNVQRLANRVTTLNWDPKANIHDFKGTQKPVYYTNRAFQGAEARYPRMDQRAFTLVFIDGSSRQAGGRVGVHIVTDAGEEYDYAIKLAFKTTKNEAEYKALVTGLTITESIGIDKVELKANSQVVVNQLREEFTMKSEKLKKCLTLVGDTCNHFRYFQIQQISRAEN
ncbi:hypothetical protein F2P56_004151 [Juglans regia]|uniref:Uncharacterized protein LOC108989917 n=2 Tax=Juglans regia TaxID=51240 RepID=A0A2I4EIK5_JUGRE|nr:uncharacterized protein LOC108989917 [Juglans regia]KAF5477518.1 hypothetical protein F2P56_004151 [Juglans regia]